MVELSTDEQLPDWILGDVQVVTQDLLPQLSSDEFWSCVRDKVMPDRGTAASDVPQHALPAQLVYQLIHETGVPEGEVTQMALEEATGRMVAHWSSPRP